MTSLTPAPPSTGDHNDNLKLPISEANYSRTLWARDAYGLPSRTNLYSSHPVYYEHRRSNATSDASENATSSADVNPHAVFLLNSHGMDVKVSRFDCIFDCSHVISAEHMHARSSLTTAQRWSTTPLAVSSTCSSSPAQRRPQLPSSTPKS